jgi:hypothetical protein
MGVVTTTCTLGSTLYCIILSSQHVCIFAPMDQEMSFSNVPFITSTNLWSIGTQWTSQLQKLNGKQKSATFGTWININPVLEFLL